MDLLSNVLSVVRLNGGAFFTAEFTAPWSIYTPPADEIARLMDTRAESVAVFHIFIEGECWISLGDRTAIRLTAGSVIILPQSPSHEMASSPGLESEPLVPLLTHPEGGLIPRINHGGGGDRTKFFCGYLECNYRFNPLIGALPGLIIASPDGNVERHVRSATSGQPQRIPYVVLPTGDAWLKSTIAHLVKEAFNSKPGTPVMLSRLIEVFYVEVLRRCIDRAPVAERGWFAAVNDPEVGFVLRLLHREPARRWTVDDLASEVGTSRSSLAARFTEIVGESPMRYLTDWRMQIAKDFIRRGELSLMQVASKVGYDSEVAFNRAFKREVGLPPGAWRDGQVGQSR